MVLCVAIKPMTVAMQLWWYVLTIKVLTLVIHTLIESCVAIKSLTMAIQIMVILQQQKKIRAILFQTAVTYFQVVRQFRSPCISWVHGDTHIASWVQFQFSAFKHKCFNPCLNCCSDTKDLLCYYWQHLHFNPVKFIKTGPNSWRRQTFEKLRKRYVFIYGHKIM